MCLYITDPSDVLYSMYLLTVPAEMHRLSTHTCRHEALCTESFAKVAACKIQDMVAQSHT